MSTKGTGRRVLRLPEVRRRVGLGIDSIYRKGRDGTFPRPVKLSERASGWFEDEIDDYLAKLPRSVVNDKPAP